MLVKETNLKISNSATLFVFWLLLLLLHEAPLLKREIDLVE